MTAMQFDAAFLMVMTGCSLVLATEDNSFGLVTRIAICVAGALCFAQAMWLWGFWIPGVNGYPWPRLTLDGAFAFVAVSRTVSVLRYRYRTQMPVERLTRR